MTIKDEVEIQALGPAAVVAPPILLVHHMGLAKVVEGLLGLME
jgi:hypothetical protein